MGSSTPRRKVVGEYAHPTRSLLHHLVIRLKNHPPGGSFAADEGVATPRNRSTRLALVGDEQCPANERQLKLKRNQGSALAITSCSTSVRKTSLPRSSKIAVSSAKAAVNC